MFSFGRDKAISSVFGGLAITNDSSIGQKMKAIYESSSYPSYVWIAQQLLHTILTWFIVTLFEISPLFGKVALGFFKKTRFISSPVNYWERNSTDAKRTVHRFSNALAALALFQLGKLDTCNKRRLEIYNLYLQHIRKLGSAFKDIRFPEQSAFYLRIPIRVKEKKELINYSKKDLIYLGDWYSFVIDPKRSASEVGYSKGECMRAEDVSREIVNLPCNPTLSNKDIEGVLKVLSQYDEAPTGLRPRHLLPALRRERNPSEAKVSSLHPRAYAQWFSRRGIKDKLSIKEITDKKLWESFNLSVSYPAYFQSWNWGEVQKRKGIDTSRFGLFNGSNLVAIFQRCDIRAKRGHFIHVRHGPVIKDLDRENVGSVVDFLKKYVIGKGASFVRISPLLKDEQESRTLFGELGFRDSPTRNLDAENRWILNLDEDILKIFAKMRKTTRYLIRKAEKENIKITRSTKISDISTFHSIYNQTAKLKQFIPHESIQEEFEEFVKDKSVTLYFAKLNERILATAMIVWYGKEAIYRHGATSEDGRKTPASYLLQWEAIKDAQKAGLEVYNFWGIAEDENSLDPWHGLSQFKKGFGGYQLDFIHSMDLPLKKSYWISYLIDYLTKLKKGH